MLLCSDTLVHTLLKGTPTNINHRQVYLIYVSTQPVVSFSCNWTNLISFTQDKYVSYAFIHFPDNLVLEYSCLDFGRALLALPSLFQMIQVIQGFKTLL